MANASNETLEILKRFGDGVSVPRRNILLSICIIPLVPLFVLSGLILRVVFRHSSMLWPWVYAAIFYALYLASRALDKPAGAQSAPAEHGQEWRRKLSRSILFVAGVFGILGLTGLRSQFIASHINAADGYDAGYDLLIVCGVFAASAILYSRYLCLPNAFSKLQKDSRPPVLFLRSFANDFAFGSFSQIFATCLAIAKHRIREIRLYSPEMQLCSILTAIGPVLSLARAEDTLNSPHATRIVVRNSVWRELLLEMMDASAVIVVDGGYSDSLKWELQQIAARNLHRKLIISFPVLKLRLLRTPESYERIRQLVSEVFHYELPHLQGNLAFLTFFPDGNPQLYRLESKSFLRGIALGGSTSVLTRILKDAKFQPHRYWLRFRSLFSNGIAAIAIVALFVSAEVLAASSQAINDTLRKNRYELSSSTVKNVAGAVRDQTAANFQTWIGPVTELFRHDPKRKQEAEALLQHLNQLNVELKENEASRALLIEHYNRLVRINNELANSMRELQASPVTNATVSKGIRSIENDILPKLRLESDQIKTLKVGNPLGDSLALLQQYSVARVDVLEALAHFWRVNNSSSEKSFEAKQTAESALRRRLEVDFNNLSMR